MGDVASVLEKLSNHGATNDTFNLSGELTFRMRDIAGFVKEAYEEMFDETVEIKLNEDDPSEFPDGFEVKATKLKKVIPYSCEPHFKEEAKKIFTLLNEKQATAQ
jgi:hypothetical protein